MRRPANIILVTLFLAIIAAPLVANLAGHDGADADAENRTLAAMPGIEASWASIAEYGPGLDAWFADHFGFRSQLVEWYGRSRYEWLGVSPVPTVIRGKADWLFYREDGGIEDMTRAQPMTPDEVAAWRRAIVGMRDWCRSRGIAYVFAIVPDKHVIYPEYLPDTVQPVTAISRTDQVVAATLDTGAVIDVRPALLTGKTRDRLYHRTDTHWNQRGAFIAYRQIIDAVRQQQPAVPPAWSLTDFTPTSNIVPGKDLAGMLGLKRTLTEDELRYTPNRARTYVVREPAGGYATGGNARIVTEIPGSSLPRAVMLRDSFTSWLAPFVSEHFSRVVYLWRNDFDAKDILAERPDVVIQEIVGRHLYSFVPAPNLESAR